MARILAEFLLEKGYRVVGMTRRSSSNAMDRIGAPARPHRARPGGRARSGPHWLRLLQSSQPSEVYHLACHELRANVLESTCTDRRGSRAWGVTRMLEAIRQVDPSIRSIKHLRVRCSAKPARVPQNELTPFHPRSPYGVAEGLRPLPDGQLPRELQTSTPSPASSSITSHHDAALSS